MSQTIIMQAGVPQEFYGVANFIRILEAAGPLTLEFMNAGREVAEALDVGEGYAEKFEVGTFDRVRLTSPTNQTVQFITRLGNSIQYDKAPIGDTNIVGSVPLALDAATIAALARDAQRPELPTNNWQSIAAAAAGVPITVFLPAANVNGAIVWAASATEVNAALIQMAFLAKASAPATLVDGEVIAASVVAALGANMHSNIYLPAPQRIAAGLGLYYYPSANGAANYPRHVRYTLL